MKTLYAVTFAATLAACFWSTQSPAADIAPFTSDGCSSFPDGTPANQSLWLECCVRHDLAYWRGGPSWLNWKSGSAI